MLVILKEHLVPICRKDTNLSKRTYRVFVIDTRRATEGPSWGYPALSLGALSPFFEPMCCELLSKFDKHGKK